MLFSGFASRHSRSQLFSLLSTWRAEDFISHTQKWSFSSVVFADDALQAAPRFGRPTFLTAALTVRKNSSAILHRNRWWQVNDDSLKIQNDDVVLRQKKHSWELVKDLLWNFSQHNSHRPTINWINYLLSRTMINDLYQSILEPRFVNHISRIEN